MTDENNEKVRGQNLRLPHTQFTGEKEDIYLQAPGRAFTEEELTAYFAELIKGNEKNIPDSIKRQYKALRESLSGMNESKDQIEHINSFKDPEQVTRHGEANIGIVPRRPKLDVSRIEKVSFEAALSSTLGLGVPVVINFWHSGFKVEVDDFSPADIIMLINRLSQVRDRVGLDTKGLLFSNDDVHIQKEIGEAILEHVTKCSVKGWNIAKMKSWLDIRDIPSLHLGALASMYPKGFPIMRTCANALNKEGEKQCDYTTWTVEDRMRHLLKLDFNRCHVHDADRFDAELRSQLAKDWDSLDEDDLIKYREKLAAKNGTSGRIGPINQVGNSRVYLKAKPPMFDLYCEEGLDWVHSIIMRTDRIMETDYGLSNKELAEKRFNLITEDTNTLKTQRLGSWIDSIVIVGDDWEKEEKDREEIYRTLKKLSSRKNLREGSVKLLDEYRRKVQYTAAGLTNYVCPACGEHQVEDLSQRFPLIPINTASYFFAISAVSLHLKN